MLVSDKECDDIKNDWKWECRHISRDLSKLGEDMKFEKKKK